MGWLENGASIRAVRRGDCAVDICDACSDGLLELAGPKSVYVIEDDEAMRTALCLCAESLGYTVQEFPCGEDFVEQIDRLTPGCVLLDMVLPGMNGLSVQAAIAKQHKLMPVIVISGQSALPTAVNAMKLGALDFLEKPVELKRLVECLDSAFRLLGVEQQNGRSAQLASNRVANLTARQFDVLRGLAAGLPNKIIAHRLGLSARTVEMHRSGLMKRLGAKSLAQVVQIAAQAQVRPLIEEDEKEVFADAQGQGVAGGDLKRPGFSPASDL